MGPAFLTTLAAGMMATMTTAPLKEVSWRFARNVVHIAFTLLVAASVLLFRDQPPSTTAVGPTVTRYAPLGATICGAAMAAVAFLFPPHSSATLVRFRWLCALSTLPSLFASCALALGIRLMSRNLEPVLTAAIILAQLTSALLLGAITAAWLLGHAYLTATRMTIAPLRHFTNLFSLTLGLRAAMFLALLAAGWAATRPGDPHFFGRILDAWLIVSLRLGVGLLAAGVFAYMVADCVRLRSTQSATGILYFGSVFVYVGELCALQFLHTHGWPM